MLRWAEALAIGVGVESVIALLGYALGGALNGAVLFTYISSSSELVISIYGHTPQAFGWIFGVNAVGVIGARQVNRMLLRRMSPDDILRRASLMAIAFGLVLWSLGVLFRRLPRIWAVLLAIALGAAVELIQGYVGRDPSWGDLLADVLGVATALLTWLVWRRFRPREAFQGRTA